MSIFTAAELDYLTNDAQLGRLATVGADGTPHVAPVGWSIAPDGTIRVGGIALPSTKKYRDVVRTGRAAIVIDDVLPPWQPRGVEVRGRAEVTDQPEPQIVIVPERVIGWGLDSTELGHHNARDVTPPPPPADRG